MCAGRHRQAEYARTLKTSLDRSVWPSIFPLLTSMTGKNRLATVQFLCLLGTKTGQLVSGSQCLVLV